MLNVRDVAGLLNISVSAVRIRISKGKLPPPDKREGGDLFWSEETLAKEIATTSSAQLLQIASRAKQQEFNQDDWVKTNSVVRE